MFRLLCEIGGPLVAVVLAALLASIAYLTAHVFTKVLWGPWLLEGHLAQGLRPRLGKAPCVRGLGFI